VRPDVVLVEPDLRGAWTLVEVQRSEDIDKQRRWLSAAGILLDARGVMGDVIIITQSASVARWAATLAPVVGPIGTRLSIEPIVLQLTVDKADQLLDSGQAELAIFAVWAVHDQTGHEAQRVVRRAVDILGADTSRRLHTPLLRAMISMLNEPLLAIVRKLFMDQDLVTITPAAQAFFDEMEASGKAKGEREFAKESLLIVLEARRFTVDDATRERVAQCSDTQTLKRWIARAAASEALESVFGDDEH